MSCGSFDVAFGHGCMLIRVKRHINLRMSVKRHVNFRMSVKRHVNLRLYANWHVSVRTSMSVKRHCKSHGTWISLYYTLKNCIQTRIVKSNRLQQSCHSDWNSLHVVYMWVCHSTRCKNIEFASWRVQYKFLFRLEANSMQNNVTLAKPQTKEKLFKKYHDFETQCSDQIKLSCPSTGESDRVGLPFASRNLQQLCHVVSCCSVLQRATVCCCSALQSKLLFKLLCPTFVAESRLPPSSSPTSAEVDKLMAKRFIIELICHFLQARLGPLSYLVSDPRRKDRKADGRQDYFE